MIEYIEGTKSIVSLIPTVKNLFNKKNRTIIEMWGSYQAFEIAEKGYHNDIGILHLTCETVNKKYNYVNYKKKGMHFYIVGEQGYRKLLQRYLNCYIYYLKTRKDLNIIDRLKLAYTKSKRWITKWQFRYEIDKYFKRKEKTDELIKEQFNKGNIDMVYLYLYKKELK